MANTVCEETIERRNKRMEGEKGKISSPCSQKASNGWLKENVFCLACNTKADMWAAGFKSCSTFETNEILWGWSF